MEKNKLSLNKRYLNFIVDLQIIGAVILSFGIYAEVVKWNYQGVSSVVLSPSSVMIAIGGFMFALNFIGWIGALRENITLLKIVSIFYYKK